MDSFHLLNEKNIEESYVNANNIVEKLYQLQYDKELLKEENNKLQSQLDSSEETVKDCFKKLTDLSHEVQILSNSISERNKLAEQIEDCQAEYIKLQQLHKEQINRSAICENELEVVRKSYHDTLAKMDKLEKELDEKNNQIFEFITIIREYEDILAASKAKSEIQCAEINQSKKDYLELRGKFRDLEEQYEFALQNISNSNTGENMHNALRTYSRVTSSSTGNTDEERLIWNFVDSTASCSTPKQPHASNSVSIVQKSLADEIMEVENEAHLILRTPKQLNWNVTSDQATQTNNINPFTLWLRDVWDGKECQYFSALLTRRYLDVLTAKKTNRTYSNYSKSDFTRKRAYTVGLPITGTFRLKTLEQQIVHRCSEIAMGHEASREKSSISSKRLLLEKTFNTNMHCTISLPNLAVPDVSPNSLNGCASLMSHDDRVDEIERQHTPENKTDETNETCAGRTSPDGATIQALDELIYLFRSDIEKLNQLGEYGIEQDLPGYLTRMEELHMLINDVYVIQDTVRQFLCDKRLNVSLKMDQVKPTGFIATLRNNPFECPTKLLEVVNLLNEKIMDLLREQQLHGSNSSLFEINKTQQTATNLAEVVGNEISSVTQQIIWMIEEIRQLDFTENHNNPASTSTSEDRNGHDVVKLEHVNGYHLSIFEITKRHYLSAYARVKNPALNVIKRMRENNLARKFMACLPARKITCITQISASLFDRMRYGCLAGNFKASHSMFKGVVVNDYLNTFCKFSVFFSLFTVLFILILFGKLSIASYDKPSIITTQRMTHSLDHLGLLNYVARFIPAVHGVNLKLDYSSGSPPI